MEKECIFCKIAAGEIPSRKVHHEDNTVVSFLDINQDIPGHTLVIPVEHYQWFQDMPDELADRVFRASRKLAQQLKAEYGADYIKLQIDGRDIPHTHIHLLPSKL